MTAWEAADYKSQVRPKIRSTMDLHCSDQFVDGLAEWLIIYIRPPEIEQSARGPRKVRPVASLFLIPDELAAQLMQFSSCNSQ